jgi:hypothetical protein
VAIEDQRKQQAVAAADVDRAPGQRKECRTVDTVRPGAWITINAANEPPAAEGCPAGP